MAPVSRSKLILLLCVGLVTVADGLRVSQCVAGTPEYPRGSGPDSKADGVHSNCERDLAPSRVHWEDYGAQAQRIKKSLRAFMPTARARSLETAEGAFALKGKQKPQVGDAVIVNGQSFEILEILGAGNEGAVFRVMSPRGPKAVKQFYSRPDLQERMDQNFQALAERGELLPARPIRVEEVDYAHGTALMEYVEGITLFDALLFAYTDGTNPRLIAELEAIVDENNTVSANLLLEIESGQVLLIDSR